jgi:hypothetical protein
LITGTDRNMEMFRRRSENERENEKGTGSGRQPPRMPMDLLLDTNPNHVDVHRPLPVLICAQVINDRGTTGIDQNVSAMEVIGLVTRKGIPRTRNTGMSGTTMTEMGKIDIVAGRAKMSIDLDEKMTLMKSCWMKGTLLK